jgi:hypothetical protein
MNEATGTILLVQESRFRLLRDDGRGLDLALSPSAPLEPQELRTLLHRRVRVGWKPARGLIAGSARRVDPI